MHTIMDVVCHLCFNGWPLICFICWNETETSICRWLLLLGASNSERDAAWLTALQKQWSRVISQWVKISTKSYWLTGEKRDGGQWARLWDLAVVINTGVLPEGASDSVFIQSDTEQRSTIVQPHWRCQSTQDGAAGGVALADTRTHMRAHTRQPRAVVIDLLFTSKYAWKSLISHRWAFLMPFSWPHLMELFFLICVSSSHRVPLVWKQLFFCHFQGRFFFRCCLSVCLWPTGIGS